jgi:hypothetical protein
MHGAKLAKEGGRAYAKPAYRGSCPLKRTANPAKQAAMKLNQVTVGQSCRPHAGDNRRFPLRRIAAGQRTA